MLAVVMAIITGLGGAFWWVLEQTHRIQVNQIEVREIKAELAGRQDVTPVERRLTQLEAKWHDTGPMLERMTKLETQQAYLTTAVIRLDEVQGRMSERLNVIDRRLTEVAANVSANQEIARKILEQQNALTGAITDIKRALPSAR
jgi:hypothetical protein